MIGAGHDSIPLLQKNRKLPYRCTKNGRSLMHVAVGGSLPNLSVIIGYTQTGIADITVGIPVLIISEKRIPCTVRRELCAGVTLASRSDL
jgi:hypothetical protein